MIFGSSKPFTVLLFFLISSLAPAQPDLSSYIREQHGFNQELINGKLFYNKFYHVLNHPYYSGEKSLPGSIVLSGIIYDDVKINYNIYSQYLVLDY
ncbi:hypothetical protein ACFLR8_04615, partial [Bacteroidota bacterium]